MDEDKKKSPVFQAALAGLLHDVESDVAAKLRPPLDPKKLEPIVELAGGLAAGGHTTSPPSHLLSIFSRLNGKDQQAYLPLASLDPHKRESIFPRSSKEDVGKNTVWESFEKDCNSVGLPNTQDPAIYLETLLELLQRHTWCLPSGGGEDVSFFNYARIRAAISACLAADGFTGNVPDTLDGNETPVALLVWGDLSGLQKFIYSLASEGAAKCLRARSFYVQLMGEAIAFRILHELKLPITNSIYVGGGGFQLLVPLSAADQLPALLRDLTERLLTVHRGELGLTVEWEKVTMADFADFGKVYDRLGKRLNRAKRQPFGRASSKTLFEQLGQPLTFGGDPLRYCVVTGEDGENLVPFKKHSDRWKSKFIARLEDLGGQLPQAAYLVLKRIEPVAPSRAASWSQALSAFGLDVQIVEEGKSANRMAPLTGEFLRVWRLQPKPPAQEANLLSPLGPEKVVSYRPFAQLTPTVSENSRKRPKTFDEFADRPVESDCGFHRWGVLRMDVDNLGNLFSKGFGSQVSLARIASLSFALRLFFEGFLPELASGKPNADITARDLREHLYIQYSGGDDVFVVGAWDALPEFARRIRKAFGEYAAGNETVTISGGVELFAEKYPLYLAAQEAGEAEHKAKSLEGKDAFCFLGEAFHWKEFEAAQALAYQLTGFVQKHQLPRSLVQTMLMFHAQQKEAIRRTKIKKPVYGRWTWLAAYQFSRVLKSLDARKPELQEARQTVETLREKFAAMNADLRQEALSARWAQFLTRGG
jgi:CRISPR-associated protein Csm1